MIFRSDITCYYYKLNTKKQVDIELFVAVGIIMIINHEAAFLMPQLYNLKLNNILIHIFSSYALLQYNQSSTFPIWSVITS